MRHGIACHQVRQYLDHAGNSAPGSEVDQRVAVGNDIGYGEGEAEQGARIKAISSYGVTFT